MEQCMSVRGVTFKVHWNLASVKAPQRADWQGTGPARSKARIRYELSENGSGTRFTYHNEFYPPGGRLGAVASRFIVGRDLRARSAKFTQEIEAVARILTG